MPIFNEESPEALVESLLLLCHNALDEISATGLAFLLLFVSKQQKNERWRKRVEIYQDFRDFFWNENDAKLRREMQKLVNGKLINLRSFSLTGRGKGKFQELLDLTQASMDHLSKLEKKRIHEILQKVIQEA
jgi:hypothetical protein